MQPQQRRRRPLAAFAALLAVALAWRCAGPAWSAPGLSGEKTPRRSAVALAPALLAATSVPLNSHAEQYDPLGRPVLDGGALTLNKGKNYTGVATFNGLPKVFVAGSTGDLGRRVVLDLVRSGYSVYCGIRDMGRSYEVQYKNRTAIGKYEMKVIEDAYIQTGMTEKLKEKIVDASVVIHVAGAVKNFDILRPTMGFEENLAEKIDLNGTKALIDAAKAKGVQKFIYVSAVLTNARALGEEVYDSSAFKDWNSFSNVLDNKHEAEEYLKKSGLDYTIIRPVPMTNDMPKDVGGIWFGKPDTLLLQSGEVGNKVSRDDVSLVVLDAVFNEAASGATVEVTDVRNMPPTPRSRWWALNPSGKA